MVTVGGPAPRRSTALDITCIAALLAYTAAVLVLTSGGYADADDRYYLKAADAWIDHGPAVGTSHWDMRLPLILAMAGAIRVGGRTELAAVVAPAAVCTVILMLATYALVRTAAGRSAALLASVLAVTAPVVAIYGQDFGPDILEASLSATSAAVFAWGWPRRSVASLAGAGLLLGVCWVDRATCAPLLGVYGLVFAHAAWGGQPGRWTMLALFAGAAAPVLAEAAYYAVMAGTPLYRLAVDARSLEIPSNHMLGQVAGGLRPPFNAALMARWRPNSLVDVHWAVNPFIDLVTNPQHGWLILPGTVAGTVLWRRTEPGSPLGWLVRLLCVWAVLILFTVLAVLNLRPQPRYFLTLTWVAAILTALWLAPMLLRHRAAAVALAAVLALNLAAARLRPDPVSADRLIVRQLHATGGTVWTTDAHRETLLLLDAGLAGRVQSLPAPAGAGAQVFLTQPEATQPPYDAWPTSWRAEPPPPWPLGPLQGVDGIRLPHGPAAVLLATPG